MEDLEKQFFAKKIGSDENAEEAEEEAPTAPVVERKQESQKEELPLPIEANEKEGTIFVLQTELPIASTNAEAGPLVPHPENFQHFTLDQRTLETIEKVATAVELNEPCLLEGETSTSKTSSIEYLAMRTKNQVARINLNGQTDTSELIGKFVPNDGQLHISFEQLLANPELLAEQSRAILKKANSEGRGLTLVESEKIAQAENMKVPDWRWQNGIIPDAMIEGRWVILDEVNLGEPQVLERINSVLERNPSLTLSENGGMKIGSGGEETTHENFRIFGTMNPAEYSGRQPMSPAYKDRWTSYKFVEAPSDKDYAAMMELMVYGEQPEVEIKGQKYRGEKTDPMFPVLEELPNFRGFIAKMAKFQSTIEDLARRRMIGRDKKEQYIFTRRGLIEFLEYLENKTVVDRSNGTKTSIRDNPREIVLRAIQYYYLDKIADREDLKKVTDQLDAIGISQRNWTHKFEAPPEKKKPEAGKEKEEEGKRNPEKLLKEAFDWIQKKKGWNRWDSWDWVISENGIMVNMQTNFSDEMPREYFDVGVTEVGFKDGERGSGIDELLAKLGGRKVVSVRAGRGWYLEIVPAGGERVAAEKPEEIKEAEKEKFEIGEVVRISEDTEEFRAHKGEIGKIEDITDGGIKVKMEDCTHVFSRESVKKIEAGKGGPDKPREEETGEKKTRKYKTRRGDGEVFEFDVSREACEPFGFYPGDRIRTPYEKVGTVIGVRDDQLWYHVDGESGACFWDKEHPDWKRIKLVEKAL